MQLILEAKNIYLATGQLKSKKRSRKKLIYAKTMETRQESKG